MSMQTSGDTVITQTNVLVFNEHHKLTRERLCMLSESIISEALDYRLGIQYFRVKQMASQTLLVS